MYTSYIALIVISSLVRPATNAPRLATNSKVGPVRAGFSKACQGARSLTKMVHASEVVLEAGVVDVSPVRNNIYAVTLQVCAMCNFSLLSLSV